MTKIVDTIDRDRRRFVGAASHAFAAAELGLAAPASAQARSSRLPAVKPGTHTSLGPLKQIDAGALNVGYAEAGPANGPPVILLHGCPTTSTAMPTLPRADSGGLSGDRA